MKHKDIICPYCNSVAELVTGNTIFKNRKDLADRYYYLCNSCDAYIGTIKGTKTPLGRLADPALRKAKVDLHSIFDPLFITGSKTRKDAYIWLATELGISVYSCHIGKFDLDQCLKAIEVCKKISHFHPTHHPK